MRQYSGESLGYWPLRDGASEGIRTLDTHVGNVMLYQAELRSLPESGFTLKESPEIASELLKFSSMPLGVETSGPNP